MKYKRIVVKIGSNVLTRSNGELDVTRISAIVDQVATLRKAGVEVVVVSSGAVAAGRCVVGKRSRVETQDLASPRAKLDTVGQRQLFSAVGQVQLMNRYSNFFREHDIVCGQVLTTKESFATRGHYLNQRNCMRVMLDSGVVPIVNENDTISVTELMFTDNDELSGLVSTMMGAEVLIILSNVDGIFNGVPGEPGAEVIREVHADSEDISEYIQAGKSHFGRGGMITKSRIASKLADQGIEVIIANGKKEDILLDIVRGKGAVCTRFVPSARAASGVKRWIAHSESFTKGEIHINKNAYVALQQPKAVSLLPVGVERIKGEFEKNDVAKIMYDGKQIGLGRVSYDSEKARTMIGKRGGKAIIHYDYLYLEQ